MRQRGRKAEQSAVSGETTAAREGLELRWRDRLIEEPRLATMVTAAGAQREPLHRWLPYRQGFSPGLVRTYLAETAKIRRQFRECPILDPFAGSGTTVVECARQGVGAIGVEALASLVFLANAKFGGPIAPLPALNESEDWRILAERVTEPAHRAGLMIAVARRFTSSGKPAPNAPPLLTALQQTIAMMADDLHAGPAKGGTILQGDARRLDMIDDGSVAGVLTSPPYLSKYDYREVNSPLETLYRSWYPQEPRMDEASQLLASTRATARHDRSIAGSEALNEVDLALESRGATAAARTVRAYLADLRQVLSECRRAALDGAVVWLVIGGARLKDVYVPMDLIIAEEAEAAGFQVENLRVARDLIPARRKFGRIGWLSPRESVLAMRCV